MSPAPARVIARVFEKADVVDTGFESPCWISTYSRGSHGYAQIGWTEDTGGRRIVTTAHVVAYAALNGPIPAGRQVDHLCHQRPCVRPSHMRLLALKANAARHQVGEDWPVEWACKQNHRPEHRFRNSAGAMECRLCYRERQKRWRERRTAAA